MLNNPAIDRLLRLEIQEIELIFCVEIKNVITTAGIAVLLLQKNKHTHQQLLVTRYIAPQMANKLKENEIQFIDTAGNAYINHFPLYIFIKGNKAPEIPGQIQHKRAFGPTGLKMIYALLCNPYLLDGPYREIARITNVALGTVGWVMKDLRELGYLVDMGKRGKKLIQKEKLIQKWCTEYPDRLRPKLLLGRFKGPVDWWQKQDFNPEYAQWGGEVAAAKITKYLKPQLVTIYTKQQYLTPLLLENKLRKDEKGEVEIFERFWELDNTNRPDYYVNTILIYADLIATGNQRNLETAEIIYERFITRYF